MLEETINKHVHKYSEGIQAVQAIGKRLVSKNEILAPEATFVLTMTMNSIANQRKLIQTESRDMESRSNKDSFVANETSFLSKKHWLVGTQKALAGRAKKVLVHTETSTVLEVTTF